MATMNISVPDEMKEWVEKQTAQGKYANSSDLMRDLIRRARNREEAIARINALIDEGIRSGFVENYDPAEHRKKLRKKFIGETRSVA